MAITTLKSIRSFASESESTQILEDSSIFHEALSLTKYIFEFRVSHNFKNKPPLDPCLLSGREHYCASEIQIKKGNIKKN